jgi:hypothetical protein
LAEAPEIADFADDHSGWIKILRLRSDLPARHHAVVYRAVLGNNVLCVTRRVVPVMSTRPPLLIARHIEALQELDSGVRAPQTALQVHFVEVCKGNARPATAHERAYLVWRAKEHRRVRLKAEEQARRRRVRMNPTNEALGAPPDANSGRWADPKLYARFVFEPLGTREDFKRDRKANFAGSRRDKL